MNDQDKDNLEPVVMKNGPGELLQVARIEQSISIEEIARQMNLNAKILQSIEEDDYSDIQSPIFVRGYLRTYARLVGLDEDEMIKLFGDFYQQDDPAIKSISNTLPEISSNDIRVKWMTYAVILGLVGLLSVWWVNNYRTDSSENGLAVADALDPIIAENLENDDSGKKKSTSIVETSELDISNVDTELNNASDRYMEKNDSQQNVDIEQSSNEKVVSVEKKITEIIIGNKETDASVNKEVIEVIEVKEVKEVKEVTPIIKKQYTKEVNAPIGTDILELNIVAASWGKIKDASKFQLVQDLLNAGSSYRLVGKAPFNIFLGNGYGVEITLNGQSIDFSKHIKSNNNTARFELEK